MRQGLPRELITPVMVERCRRGVRYATKWLLSRDPLSGMLSMSDYLNVSKTQGIFVLKMSLAKAWG